MAARKLTALSHTIWLTIGLFTAFVIALTAYVLTEKQIDRANELRQQSFLLVNELRQSSYDLTSMARSYVATGNPQYQQYYQDIVAIRDGRKARPVNYRSTYWDLVIANKPMLNTSTEVPVALLNLMQQAEFTKDELNALSEAQTNSNYLTSTEYAAMALVTNATADLESKRAIALAMLFDDHYNQAKASIMQPINTFYNLMDARTLTAVKQAKYNAMLMRLTLIGFSLSLIIMLWHISQALNKVMGGTVDEIYTQIARIGRGDFSLPIQFKNAERNSILKWLAETQNNLKKLQQERITAENAQQDSDTRYRILLDISTAGIWHIDNAGYTLYMNSSMCQLLQINHLTELNGQTFHQFFNEASLERMRHEHLKRSKGEASTYEIELIGKLGKHYNVLISGAPLLDMQGNLSGLIGTFQDISARKQAELALSESAEHTQAILNNMHDGVITINKRGIIESFNKAACTIFNYNPNEVLGHNVSMLIPDHEKRQHHNHIKHHIKSGSSRILGNMLNLNGQRKNGDLFPMSLSISQISHKGKATFIGLIRDITEQRQNEEKINHLAFYDSLTNLPNRRLLFDRLQQAIHTSSRTDQHGALMLLDLDHFKQLNDTLGHDVGDLLLQQAAERLQACVRKCDSIARMGGDEFVILLEVSSTYPHEATSQAENIALKVIASLGQPYNLREHTYVITPSIGIVTFFHHGEPMEELLKKADVAMYQAKAAGRNNLRFYDPSMQAAVAVRAMLEKSMRRALTEQEFILHYQLQVNTQGKPTGAEALVRWCHPEHGMVSPASFIPLAEETGMILPLGQWVLETACAQLVEWAKNAQSQTWTMAVNVSVSQFAQPDFVANVDQALLKTGADPRLLKLELTESMLVKDVDDVIVKMFEIKALGVTFSLDDFGTGYSSLSYLKRLPLDQLKIDQSFVRDLMTDPNDAVIARSIIALGHNLGLKVIAEGVETAEQQQTLANMGCDAYQGYYFARPVAANDLQATINKIPVSLSE